MSDVILLQDWITVGGAAGAPALVQPEAGWLDLQHFQDIAVILTCAANTGALGNFAYQTAPAPNNEQFIPMVPAGITPGAGTITETVFLFQTATVPLARYLRWSVSSTAGYTTTFRIHVLGITRGEIINGR